MAFHPASILLGCCGHHLCRHASNLRIRRVEESQTSLLEAEPRFGALGSSKAPAAAYSTTPENAFSSP